MTSNVPVSISYILYLYIAGSVSFSGKQKQKQWNVAAGALCHIRLSRLVSRVTVALDFAKAEPTLQYSVVKDSPRVKIGKRGERGTNPGVGNGILNRLICAVIAVINESLVFVGVSKEDSGDHVGRVSFHNLIEVIRPAWSGICTVPWSIVISLHAFLDRHERSRLGTVL